MTGLSHLPQCLWSDRHLSFVSSASHFFLHTCSYHNKKKSLKCFDGWRGVCMCVCLCVCVSVCVRACMFNMYVSDCWSFVNWCQFFIVGHIFVIRCYVQTLFLLLQLYIPKHAKLGRGPRVRAGSARVSLYCTLTPSFSLTKLLCVCMCVHMRMCTVC